MVYDLDNQMAISTNIDTLVQAKDFMERVRGKSNEDIHEAVKALPKTVQDTYWELRKAAYFVPENAVPERTQIHQSLSGKYRLVTTPYKTSGDGWDYTQGLVYQGNKLIAEVQRDYSAFPFMWLEDHANGHDYLVCGASYMGQTVIELDTGKRRDAMSEGSEDGFGFCWADYTYNPATNILIVDGCHWACPYEFRFYDFSDPMAGWPEIKSSVMIDADEKHPTFEPDGTIKVYQTAKSGEAEDSGATEIRAITTFRREGLKLVVVNEWVSEAEQKEREQTKEAERKSKEWRDNFKATDPLYLAYLELIKDPALSPEGYESVGGTYSDWSPDFKGYEKRWCRRIVTRKETGSDKHTIDLEWAVDTGPIKLVIFKGGNFEENKWFPHSVDGMKSAFEYAKKLNVVKRESSSE